MIILSAAREIKIRQNFFADDKPFFHFFPDLGVCLGS